MADRNLWPIHVIGVTLVAFTMGASTSDAVAMGMRGALTVDGGKTKVRSGSTVGETRDFHEASRRNIFGEPVFVGEDAFTDAAPAEELPEEPEEPMSDEIVPTELQLGLVGTSVFQEVEFSLASVVDLAERGSSSEVYALKECGEPPCRELPGGAVLKAIEVERIVLFNPDENRLEELRLDGEKKKKKKKKVGKPPAYLPKPPKKPKKEAKGHGFDITKLSETSYEIPRSQVGKALGQMAGLARDARVVPVADGFKLAWIRKGSVFESLGVKRGDIIKSANGYDVTSMEGAMAAFSKLKDANDISLDLMRGGSKVTMEYRVAD